MSQIGKDGEIKHTSIGSETYVSHIQETFSEMYVVSRHDMIQDSAGFLQSIPRLMATDAARLISRLAYTSLLSATSFTAANNNLLTGANSALSSDSLSDAIKLMRGAVDNAGHPIDMQPAVLVVGQSLEDQAKVILASRELRNNSATGSYGTANPHENRVRLIVEPRIESSAYAGSSQTQWFLSAAPHNRGGIISLLNDGCLLYTSPSPRDGLLSRMPSSA